MPTIQFITVRRIFTVFFLLLVAWQMNAQITSNDAFYSESTEYGGGAVEDPIFFYSNMVSSILTAPTGTGASYQWYQYSTSNKAFEIIVSATNQSLNINSEGGYRVLVDGTENYYCWNFVPQNQLDSIGTTPDKEACNNLRLTAYVTKPLIYYNHHRSDAPAINVDYGFIWSSIPSGPMDGVTEYTKQISAPTEDTDYSVVFGEKFIGGIQPGNEDKSYISIAVEASYSFESESTSDNEATEGSAPMVVRFTDESKGGVTDWEWTFGEAGKDFIADPIFTFQKFGEYPVTLKVRNMETECEDEITQETFNVQEMIVAAPNAFTPFSSPGENDEFKVVYRSVAKFTMLIYNRWGRKVYQSSNPAAGWDGRIGNQKAEPGVYFYRIEAESYNKEEKKIQLEGAVHLIVN